MSPDLIYFAAAERSINTQPNVGRPGARHGFLVKCCAGRKHPQRPIYMYVSVPCDLWFLVFYTYPHSRKVAFGEIYT